MSSAGGAAAPAPASTIPVLPRRNDTELAGASASQSSLAKLESALAQLKLMQIAPFLERAMEALKVNDAAKACDWALKALEQDERSGFAWRLLGIGREMAGDHANAIRCYESALALSPDDTEIANDIGRLAYSLDMKDLAGKLFAHFWQAHPELPDGANNLACVLRDQNLYDEAIEVLKPAIGAHPEQPLLWNTLASTLTEKGDYASALTFFDEALRLDPDFAKARYNRGNAKLQMLDFDGALTDCDGAMALTTAGADLAMMRMARSTIKLCQGQVGEGWDDYEARLDPLFAGVTHFGVDQQRWQVGDDLAGKSLLVMGEQGLGDEVLFANVIPDVIEALGPKGKLAIAVEPRLVDLFQRSFPTARVGPHATYKIETHVVKGAPFIEPGAFDLWVPMASLLRQYRRSEAAYPQRDRFLIPDEARIAHWRQALKAAPKGPKVGILWKSMLLQGSRAKHFSPFEQWAPVLQTPGVVFVNLQYGDCAEELALAKRDLGVEFWTPPGIDLKQDLDDLAALCCVVDRIIGFSNATTNIAAAAGAPVWMLASQAAWTRLGSTVYPWYPQVRVFDTPVDRDWAKAMGPIARALAADL